VLKYFVPTQENGYKPYLLRTKALSILTLTLFIFNLIIPATAEASSLTAENVIRETNEQRQKYNLGKLTSNVKLTTAALAKANNMFEEQYWDHFGPNGETPWQFIIATEYDYTYAGENLAKGFDTSEGVVQAWLASPTHRENLLSGNYKDIGIAVVKGELQGEEVYLVVQMFGNLTQETEENVIPEVPETIVQEESGEISSISITTPAQGELLNDPSTSIQGTVDQGDLDYSLELLDNSESLKTEDKSGSSWEIEKGSDWTEGDHNVEVRLEDNIEVSDTINFTVDSKPPVIDEESLNVFLADGEWTISIFIEEETTIADIVNGDQRVEMERDEDLFFKTRLSENEIGDSVKILASDPAGNISELDITDQLQNEEGDVLGQFIGNVNIKDTVNGTVLGMVFLLLSIEIGVYWRRGLLSQNGGSLFTVGAWWALVMLGYINGFSGALV
jgi:uncharacterized protein YkwD